MRNVYKPKAANYCAANLTGISYISPCKAYINADYSCSNGASGRVGDGKTCQSYSTLYEMANKACCEGLIPTNRPVTITIPSPTPYLKPCPYICRDKCLVGEISIEGYKCPSTMRTNCCTSSVTPTQPITIFPTAIPITVILTKTPTSQLSPIPISQQVPTKTPTPQRCLSKYARCTYNLECCSGLCVSRMCR